VEIVSRVAPSASRKPVYRFIQNHVSKSIKRVGWPQVLLEFVARDHFAGLRQQHREHLEKADAEAAFSHRASEVHLRADRTSNGPKRITRAGPLVDMTFPAQDSPPREHTGGRS
jgi:hypothetical protein